MYLATLPALFWQQLDAATCATNLSVSSFKMAAPRCMAKHDFKQQYTSNMEVGSCGDLDMSRVYPKTLFRPMFYSWWNCPLRNFTFEIINYFKYRSNGSSRPHLNQMLKFSLNRPTTSAYNLQL